MSEFKLIYFDADRDEKPMHNVHELEIALTELQNSVFMPESVNLISPNGDILTIAIGTDFGFVQFEDATPNSPYLIAVDKNKLSQKDYRNVDAGGTPTPIPEFACLPTEKVIEIVLYYFNNMKIPKHIEWKEI